MKSLKFILIIVMGMLSVTMMAQSAKSSFKAGKKFVKAGEYNSAIPQLDKAIELDPNYGEAYQARAESYEALGEVQKAIDDYDRALALEPKEDWIAFKSADLNYSLENYQAAIAKYRQGLMMDSKNLLAYNNLVNALILEEQYQEAFIEANKALNVKENYTNYFNRARLNFITANFVQSEADYRRAIAEDASKIDAVIGMARSQYEQTKLPQALGSVNQALGIDQKNKEALTLRSRIYHKNKDYVNAINDISKVLLFYPDAADINDVYKLRGIYQMEFNQQTAAIGDFNQILANDPENAEALYLRATCYADVFNADLATADFKAFIALAGGNELLTNQIEDAQKKVYDLNMETNKPKVVMDQNIEREAGVLEFVRGEDKVVLKGHIEDQSALEYVTFNDKSTEVLDGSFNPDDKTFEISFDLDGIDELVVSASDVYNNKISQTYKIIRTEVDAPEILIMDPMTSDNGEIFVETDDALLYIEGVIQDESLIDYIHIDGVTAGFNSNSLNPQFWANVEVKNKSSITVTAEDIYGNTTEMRYIINRDMANAFADNPMGRTWIVYIENSNYESFPNLQGPAKDITMIRSALANYRVPVQMHKKDMTKEDLEKFFRIELRDQIKKYKANSLIIWYAGHGAYMNETGYWIPVDADRDDEFSYFDLNALRASMESYVDDLTHLLVVSDACESGPSFYLAMRSAPKDLSCNNWKLTKSKSAQVFSSAGYELAADNSIFAKSFAQALKQNPNTCIPIDDIVGIVSKAVVENNDQRPQFGQIKGFRHDGGSFFFMRKAEEAAMPAEAADTTR